MLQKFFDKEAGLGVSLNEKLVEELHKAIIKKFKRRKLMGDLKAVSRQQMQLKWNHHILKK